MKREQMVEEVKRIVITGKEEDLFDEIEKEIAMEREKMIEEIAQDYDDIRTQSYRDYIPQSNMGIAYYFANALADKGYCKIPDGAVVLTKEEYERLKALPEKVHAEMDERMKEELAIEKRMGETKAEQARKDTARGIIKEVKAFLDMQTKAVNEWANIDSRHTICRDCYVDSQKNRIAELQKIAEKNGVEVEE